jgi:hypothetical protein
MVGPSTDLQWVTYSSDATPEDRSLRSRTVRHPATVAIDCCARPPEDAFPGMLLTAQERRRRIVIKTGGNKFGGNEFVGDGGWPGALEKWRTLWTTHEIAESGELWLEVR